MLDLSTQAATLAEGTLILPGVLERLTSGNFVAARSASDKPSASAESDEQQNRRDTTSPLAIAKRCIRYQPDVFTLRRREMLRMAQALNAPEKKILMISAPTGCGKTAFARALLELLGGANQQAIWVDCSPHQSADTLVHYMLLVVEQLLQFQAEEGELAPSLTDGLSSLDAQLDTLALALEHLVQVPILLVLDEVHHFVTPQQRLGSRTLKDLLNVCLAFPNIKVLLSGQTLPYTDLEPNSPAVMDAPLPPLSRQQFDHLFHHETAVDDTPASGEPLSKRTLVDETLKQQLYEASAGHLWLARAFAHYSRHTSVRLQAFAHLYQQHLPVLPTAQHTSRFLLKFLMPRLSREERHWLALCANLRHPTPEATVERLANRVYSSSPPQRTLRSHLKEQSLLKPLFRWFFPPQQVLSYLTLQQAEGAPSAEQSLRWWCEVFAPLRASWQPDWLAPTEANTLHTTLKTFYTQPVWLEETGLPAGLCRQEALYHQSCLQLGQQFPFFPGMSLAPEEAPVEATDELNELLATFEANEAWADAAPPAADAPAVEASNAESVEQPDSGIAPLWEQWHRLQGEALTTSVLTGLAHWPKPPATPETPAEQSLATYWRLVQALDTRTTSPQAPNWQAFYTRLEEGGNKLPEGLGWLPFIAPVVQALLESSEAGRVFPESFEDWAALTEAPQLAPSLKESWLALWCQLARKNLPKQPGVALKLARGAYKLAEREHWANWQAVALSLMTLGLYHQRHKEKTTLLLTQALEQTRDTELFYWQAQLVMTKAQILQEQGETQAALGLLAEATGLAGLPDSLWGQLTYQQAQWLRWSDAKAAMAAYDACLRLGESAFSTERLAWITQQREQLGEED